jgi:ClpP class serine protease
MDPSRLHKGPGSFFWLMGSGPKPSERKGDVCTVFVRGELEFHRDDWGCCESYEGILERMQAAITGQDLVEQHASAHGHEADFKALDASPPRTIIVSIDSPGGVVSGLNETCRALRKMVKEHPEIEFCAYVNEMAASAAYALACSFPEIICPRSAILGSIGVISTMISQARKNQKDGYDIRLLTSGARKADGHLHAPITDEAVEVEQDRVEKLAASFFKMVSKSRGLSVETIESYQAGIFLGPDAVKRGLADAVMSFDDVLLGASREEAQPGPTEAGGNQTDRREQKALMGTHQTEAVMPIALSALIAKTEKAIAKEKDPTKLASLLSALDAYKKTEKHIEHTSSEEGDDGDDDSDNEDDDEDEDEGSEEESATEPPMKGKAKKAKKAEDDDEEEDEEESEEESSKAVVAAVKNLTGMTGKKALGALQAMANLASSTAKDVAEIKRTQKVNAKASIIESARSKGQITKAEATFLQEQKLSTVQGFVAMREKSGFVNVDENTLLKPKHVAPGTEESLPQETRDMIEAAVSAWNGDKTAYRAQLVKAHLAAHTKQVSAVLNGASGRY